MKLHCTKCGFKLEIYKGSKGTVNKRGIIRAIREHLVTASLFGCGCFDMFKKGLKELQGEL